MPPTAGVVFLIVLAVIIGAAECQIQPVSITIGLSFSQNESYGVDYESSAGATLIALDRIYEEGLLPQGSNISFVWLYEECIEETSISTTYDLIVLHHADFILTPPCTDAGILGGAVATYYNTPFGMWGISFASRASNSSINPTVLSALPNFADMSVATCEIMNEFGWDEFAFIYHRNEDGGCQFYNQDLESLTAMLTGSCKISYKTIIENWSKESIDFVVEQIRTRARIVVLCFDIDHLFRDFLLILYDAGLYTDEYVYIIADGNMTQGLGYNNVPYWVDKTGLDSARDKDAEVIGRRSFVLFLDMDGQVKVNTDQFYKDVVRRIADPPYNCAGCDFNRNASDYSGFLHDAILLYGYALNRTIARAGSSSPDYYRNGTLVARNAVGVVFDGFTGNVTMGDDGGRNSIYSLGRYQEGNTMERYLTFVVENEQLTIKKHYDNEESEIWDDWGYKRPPHVPVCGYSGNECPVDILNDYIGWWIALLVVVVFIGIGLVGSMLYLIQTRIQEIERQNRLWRVSFVDLQRVQKKTAPHESTRSLQSGPSTTSTRFTIDSLMNSKHITVFDYLDEKVVGYKHSYRGVPTKEDMNEFRHIRHLDHENINRFFGVCLDGPHTMSIWRFCPRGSLRDVIKNTTFNLDAFFIFSIVRDLVEGLTYLHASPLQYHGYLKSSCCLVDDRWQLKVSGFGLRNIHRYETRKAKQQLWTAPELISDHEHFGTKAGDIYSMAIVCSEVVNMQPPWQPSNTRGNPDEIVYLVKKRGKPSVRPLLQPAVPDLNPALLHLIRDSWSDNPEDRPKITTIRSLIRSMMTGRMKNLMDHAFGQLEQYATTLEEEVEQRTREFAEEKKKSDLLLYRMLPKQVAEKLKAGQSVEPESFDCVTVFFSDVVSFTALASRCTPLQVVTLLNDLYTLFDATIGEYDVYKVETIGDGYLCVSGLPHRNGNEHARHIADMSLALNRGLQSFRVPHLPEERISLRIGIHTGGCVAGVVGLAMPRYCLFGDTINTASRMESNGKPNKIHMSADANRFLTTVIGGYMTESRGEVIIKGKGVMETFWLLGSLREDSIKVVVPPPVPAIVQKPSEQLPTTASTNNLQPMYQVFKSSS